MTSMSGSMAQSNKVEEPRALLHDPLAGSSTPSMSLGALWRYTEPALDHILRSPTDETGKANSLEYAYAMGIHSNIYNFFSRESESQNRYYSSLRKQKETERDRVTDNTSPDLYMLLDKYFQSAVQEIFQSAPVDGISLVEYYARHFERFAAGTQAINRLLNYVNRHYVKRAQDEDRGWLRIADLMDVKSSKQVTGPTTIARDRVPVMLKDRRISELRVWGYEEGCGEEVLAAAERSAAAATSADRIVPVNSLGLRRWRTEMAEPLLSVPRVVAKPSRGGGPTARRPTALKSRLSRAVQALQESQILSEPEKLDLATKVAVSLRTVGIRPEHPLRKKLDRSVQS